MHHKWRVADSTAFPVITGLSSASLINPLWLLLLRTEEVVSVFQLRLNLHITTGTDAVQCKLANRLKIWNHAMSVRDTAPDSLAATRSALSAQKAVSLPAYELKHGPRLQSKHDTRSPTGASGRAESQQDVVVAVITRFGRFRHPNRASHAQCKQCLRQRQEQRCNGSSDRSERGKRGGKRQGRASEQGQSAGNRTTGRGGERGGQGSETGAGE